MTTHYSPQLLTAYNLAVNDYLHACKKRRVKTVKYAHIKDDAKSVVRLYNVAGDTVATSLLSAAKLANECFSSDMTTAQIESAFSALGILLYRSGQCPIQHSVNLGTIYLSLSEAGVAAFSKSDGLLQIQGSPANIAKLHAFGIASGERLVSDLDLNVALNSMLIQVLRDTVKILLGNK